MCTRYGVWAVSDGGEASLVFGVEDVCHDHFFFLDSQIVMEGLEVEVNSGEERSRRPP